MHNAIWKEEIKSARTYTHIHAHARIYHICIHKIQRLIPVFSVDFSLSVWPSVALLFGPMHRHVNWTMIFIFVRKKKHTHILAFYFHCSTQYSQYTPICANAMLIEIKRFFCCVFNSFVCALLHTYFRSIRSFSCVCSLFCHSHIFSSAFNYFFMRFSMNCIILHM